MSSEENRIKDSIMMKRLEAGLNPKTGEAFLGTNHWCSQDVVTTLISKIFRIWEKETSDERWQNFYITSNSSTASSFEYTVYN